jgi:hypothetical protein
MRPLETHLEMTSHVRMLNRVKEMLVNEGMLSRNPTRDDLRDAMVRWVDLIEKRVDDEAMVNH